MKKARYSSQGFFDVKGNLFCPEKMISDEKGFGSYKYILICFINSRIVSLIGEISIFYKEKRLFPFQLYKWA
jgi:hypothetical protein